ncbi:MAG: hypothetical protein ABFR53_09140 [Actinomycetota bacterium]
MRSDRQHVDETAHDEPGGFFNTSDRVELVATIAIAIATILTAWSAFQAGKWGGTQSINFSEAGAARTESTRADTLAGQLTQIDVAMYLDWVSAVVEESRDGLLPPLDDGNFDPVRGTVSGFIANRFRDEFVPAVDAWLATDPVNNPDAPNSPFEMEEYVVAKSVEADELAALADEKAKAARTANQNGDNYVLTMVLFASVLFFAGVSSKMASRRNRILMLSFGIIVLLAGIVILSTLPILV